MKKGDKIIDIRDNTEHVVECVDVYDEVTLVFTESKKYIPIESIRNLTDVEMVRNIITENPDILKNYEDEIITSVSESLELHLKNVSKKLGLE